MITGLQPKPSLLPVQLQAIRGDHWVGAGHHSEFNVQVASRCQAGALLGFGVAAILKCAMKG